MKEWKPAYICAKCMDVDVLEYTPPSPEMIRVTEKVRNIERLKHYNNLLAALNLPIGSGVHRVGKLAPNDDFHLNERHFYNVFKGME